MGGFNRSSQHLEKGGYNDGWKEATFGSIGAGETQVTRKALGSTDQRAPAVLGRRCGGEGKRRLGEGSRTPPEGRAYLKVQVLHPRGDEAVVSLPFDRYYMDEYKAPETEQAYRQRVASGDQDTFVTIRVLDGTAVLEELYVGGVPATELPG